MPSFSSDNWKTASSPYINRFLQPDTIITDLSNPQSWNRYSYVTNRPVNFNDPTGHMLDDDLQGDGDKCDKDCAKLELAFKIQKKYKNVKINNPRSWEFGDLQEIQYGLIMINGRDGFDDDKNAMTRAFGNVTFVSVSADFFSGNKVGDANWSTGVIRLEPGATEDTVIHEMGHILDGSLNRLNNRVPSYAKRSESIFDSGDGATDYGKTNGTEDFADSFLAVIKYGSVNNPAIDSPRVDKIMNIIDSYIYFDHRISYGR